MIRKEIYALVFCLILATLSFESLGQNSSKSSGTWSDNTLWLKGSVPVSTEQVTVNHPVILDTDLIIDQGNFTFNAPVINLSNSGLLATLTLTKGSLTVTSGTTSIKGAVSLSGSTLIVRQGATLMTGPVSLGNGNSILVEDGAAWIVTGNFVNSNSSGKVSIDGLLKISGDYTTNNGNLEILGSGEVITTGRISNQGSSKVFGSSNSCSPGPCSGRNLCSFNNAIQSKQVICAGSNSMPLGSTTNGSPSSNSAVYQWEFSTTSSISGFSNISGLSSAESYSPGALSQTTWFRRKVTLGNCTGTSPPIQIKVQSSGGWRGITSDWDNPMNWCGGSVPDGSLDVEINSGVPNQPVASNTVNCKELVVNDGAVLTVSGSGMFNIYGDLFNNGSLNISSGTVAFNGSTTQHVSGYPLMFYNLTINNSSPNTVIFDTFVSIFNQLTMLQGNVNLGGYNMTLGTSRTNPGTLSRTLGTIYNGYLTRYFRTSGVSLGSVGGLFPVGTSTQYRPVYLGFSSLSGSGASGGSAKVTHIDARTTTAVSFLDNGDMVERRTDARWDISTTNGFNQGSGINPFSLRTEGTGFGLIGDVSDLRLTLANSVVGMPATNAGTLINPQINRTSLSLSELSNSFYIGSINASQTPLPLRLLRFFGKPANGGAVLNWTTASEINFDHFLLERSLDGITFESVARIIGTGGPGVTSQYTYLDTDVNEGNFYYRLKSIDLNESYEYSNVILVYVGEPNEKDALTIFPNPAVEGKFTIRANMPLNSGQFMLFDQFGKSILQGNINQGETEVVIGSRLNAGIYFIRVPGVHKSFKVVIGN